MSAREEKSEYFDRGEKNHEQEMGGVRLWSGLVVDGKLFWRASPAGGVDEAAGFWAGHGVGEVWGTRP